MDSLLSLLLALATSLGGIQTDAMKEPIRAVRAPREVRAVQLTRPVQPVTTRTSGSTNTESAPTQVQTAQAPQPTPQSTTPSDFRAQVETFVLEETNAARAERGLAPLSADSQAAAVARAHSADMLAKDYFSHTNQSGCNAGCRLTNAGYPWRSYGENIHWMSGYNLSARESAKKIVTDWMNSPPHRENILGNFKYAGVGIAVEGSKIYSTTDYTTK